MPLEEHDLRGVEDAEAQLKELMAVEAQAPFDLKRGPLVRGQLIRLREHEHVLLLTQHHIVSDGWSMGVLVRELGRLYGAFSRGEENPLTPLDIQYPDYAAWQREWLSGERLQRQSGVLAGGAGGCAGAAGDADGQTAAGAAELSLGHTCRFAWTGI